MVWAGRWSYWDRAESELGTPCRWNNHIQTINRHQMPVVTSKHILSIRAVPAEWNCEPTAKQSPFLNCRPNSPSIPGVHCATSDIFQPGWFGPPRQCIGLLFMLLEMTHQLPNEIRPFNGSPKLWVSGAHSGMKFCFGMGYLPCCATDTGHEQTTKIRHTDDCPWTVART